ncbi:MAG TPA: non-ribosomal peptide synthetase [Candidatus Binatia bacterium]|nr:non-ribosomal peptide synthetase [Candidatus Binatia bacterium]
MKPETQLIDDQLLKTPSAGSSAACVFHLVEKLSQATPGAAAISSWGEVVTYGELNRRANVLARHLRSLGVGPETLVGVFMERSAASVLASLAIFKAGGAYLPLDPALPEQRLAFMLADSQVTAVVCSAGLRARLPQGPWAIVVPEELNSTEECGDARAEVSGENLAYVIYTSGSTGQPKGVEITHASLMNLVNWHLRAFEVKATDRACFQAAVGFDAAVWEVWPYLACGASIAIPDEATRNNPAAMRDWLIETRVTITFLPTAIAERMLALEWPADTALRFLLTGADALHKRPPKGLPFTLVNNYGPTEGTVVATSGTVTADASAGLPTIGRAIDKTEIHLLDEKMEPVFDGGVGEIYIGGAGVARGYRNNAALTAERFVRHPGTGVRLYRTGDLARFLPNGELEFLGRVDEQVKIRGFRVEPGEIVSALNSVAGVVSSAVAPLGGSNGDKRLAAYLVLSAEAQVNVAQLREALARRLPDYMVPSVFGRVSALPLTRNGKVDYAALPALNEANTLPETKFVAPQTIVERRLAAILAPLLHVDRVSAKDNFFLLGGHSLLGTQLITKIKESFDVELSLLSLFDHPTLEEMSVEVENLILAKIAAANANGSAVSSVTVQESQ